jgi:hypothetical protein
MTLYYRCTRHKSQPEVNLSICIGRWIESQESKKRSPCKSCPIFAVRVFDLAKSVGMSGYKESK